MNHWPTLVYGLFAMGALGVYCLLPRAERSMRAAGAVLGAAALAGFLVLFARYAVSPQGSGVVFLVSGAIAIAAAVKVITHERPVYSALYFVLVVLAITPLLILQSAEFAAAALVIIYAGAILVTYVFVIMLAQQSGAAHYDRQSREPFIAVLAGFLTTAVVAAGIMELPVPAGGDPTAMGGEGPSNTEVIGRVLMADYSAALEIAGVLLLIAMIGAVVISRKRVPTEDVVESRTPGMIGREVPPY
ncbi:MAG: hypothetical protein HOP29_15125 [Phycisphaerales bacterium]|nr:hypothetical protein [Phycisphaerales bacterium]